MDPVYKQCGWEYILNKVSVVVSAFVKCSTNVNLSSGADSLTGPRQSSFCLFLIRLWCPVPEDIAPDLQLPVTVHLPEQQQLAFDCIDCWCSMHSDRPLIYKYGQRVSTSSRCIK